MHFKIVLDAVGGKGVRKLYYLQALRVSGCDQRAHHVRKCFYLHIVMGVGAHHVPKCYYLHTFRGVGERRCKQFGKLGVTKEHLMCANAIICTYVQGLEMWLDRSWREGARKSY